MVKENGQIGPFDVIRVKFRANQANSSLVKRFFKRNNFTDDLILNASFDQLDGQSASDDERPTSLTNGFCLDNVFDGCDRDGHSAHARLQHSVSLLDNMNVQYTQNHDDHRKHMENDDDEAVPLVSMCYLPPYSMTSMSSQLLDVGDQANHHHHAHHQTMLTELDNRYVDKIIDEASRCWRNDLLTAYRTQWSCVARLRAEMVKLRQFVRDRDQTIDQLRRENYQLRTSLLQSEF